MKRSADIVHRQMRQGLNGLATVASLAPLVGFFGTLVGVASCFRGTIGERRAIMAAMAEGLSESLAPAALGLMVAIVAFCCYKYLIGRLESLDVEMENASLQLG